MSGSLLLLAGAAYLAVGLWAAENAYKRPGVVEQLRMLPSWRVTAAMLVLIAAWPAPAAYGFVRVFMKGDYR
mgnify:FL=1